MKAFVNGHKEVVKLFFDHSDSKNIDLNAKAFMDRLNL